MADIEVVIKMPEEMFKNIQSENFWLDSGLTLSNAYDFIRNGKPLPKGHGDLIDRGKLKTHFIGTEQGTDLEVYLETTIIDAQAIIKADKSESEEK